MVITWSKRGSRSRSDDVDRLWWGRERKESVLTRVTSVRTGWVRWDEENGRRELKGKVNKKVRKSLSCPNEVRFYPL